ncbi:MAG: hypothetical protein KBT19_03160 [Lachnospiraceae bacterium]|nr:hypothetical protein [Candidatus Colinaster equi]
MMKKDIAIIVLAGALCLCCSFMITNFIIQRGHEKYPDATANPSSVSDKQFGEIGESILAGEDDKGGAEPDSLLATDMTDEVETAVIDENAIIFEWNPKDFKIQGQNFDFECIEKLCDIMKRGPFWD